MLIVEESRRRRETLQKIYSWLRQRSKTIHYEEGGFLEHSKIVAELKPEWQLERVEVTEFTVSYGKHSKTYLRVLGMSEEGTFVNITIRYRSIFDVIALGLGLAKVKDISSGDPLFDKNYKVKSGTPEIAIKLLRDSQFRDYVSAIRDLRKFEIRGGKHLHFVTECEYDTPSVVNAILAMEKAAEILAPEVKARPVIVESAKPIVLKVEPERIVTPEILSNLRKEFEKLSMYVSKLKFEPSKEHFTRVIVTPLLSEIDYVQYRVDKKLVVEALDNLEKAVEKPITIEIYTKETLPPSRQAISIDEVKNLFDIKCEDAEVLKRVSEAYVLLDYLSKIKKLSVFSIRLHETTLEVRLECSVSPENIGRAYEAVKEAAWWTKFNLLI